MGDGRVVDALRRVKLLGARSVAYALRTGRGFRFRQVVVCGFPRSGTSLLYNMLSASLPGFRVEPFERSVERRLHRLGSIASKYPMDVFTIERLPELNILDKRLHVIAMIRDPRDLVTSRHPIVPDRYFIGHDHSWWPQDPNFDEWKFDAPGITAIHDALLGAQRAV